MSESVEEQKKMGEKIIAIVIAVAVIAFAVYGAWDFAAHGFGWSFGAFILSIIAIILPISAILWILGTIFFFMELAGYTFTFQVGYENATHDRIELQIGDVHTSNLGAGGITDINLTNISSAQTALTCIDNALTSLNGVLADLGGVQNKLTYRQGKINVQIENFTASESTIRDVDMALEMANLTKNQILVQTGMAMLAQANALPQNIIQLLR